MKIKIVARPFSKLACRMKAATMWAAVRRIPPIKMVFLGPNLAKSLEGTIPTKAEALTAKEN